LAHSSKSNRASGTRIFETPFTGDDAFVEGIVAIDEGLYGVVAVDGLLEGLEIGVSESPEVIVVEVAPGGFGPAVVEIICGEEEPEELVELVFFLRD